MPPKPELLHHSTTKTLVVEEGVAGEAPFGRFSSLSQGYRSHVPLVADPQIQETSTGGEATSGSIVSPFNIRDSFHLCHQL